MKGLGVVGVRGGRGSGVSVEGLAAGVRSGMRSMSRSSLCRSNLYEQQYYSSQF